MEKKYAGGKNSPGTFHKIINFIPECDVLVELFAGSAAITRNINRPKLCIVNDIYTAQVNKLKDHFNSVPAVIVINYDAISLLQNFRALIKYLYDTSGIRFHFYIDPPYPLTTIKSKQPIYKYSLSQEDHTKLLYEVGHLAEYCTIQIQTYKNSQYDKALQGWNIYQYNQFTRQGDTIETIYYNYKVDRLQDYQYLGNNFRERELIKKRTNNFINKFTAMNDQERTLITGLLRSAGIV